jgi:hypothetical protein
MRTVFTLFNLKNPSLYLVVFLPAILMFSSCVRPKTYIKPDDMIFYLKDSNPDSTTILKKFYANKLRLDTSQVTIKECSCDKKLIKLQAAGAASILIEGVGVGQVQTNPTGGVGTDLKSGFASIKPNIDRFEPNIVIESPEIRRINGRIDTTFNENFRMKYFEKINYTFETSTTNPTTIAILDSGLPQNILDSDFIWKDSTGNKGWNFIDNNNKLLEEKNPHSNNVVAFLTKELADRGIKNVNLMILKVLDSQNQGDYFDILCGILYAYKNNASILNLSLGYYGQHSDFFENFLEAKNITNPYSGRNYESNKWIVTAAGNIDTQSGKREKIFHNRNLDTRKNKFYPAYFAKDFENVFAITSIESLENVANNQNYSKKAVDVGVKTDAGVNFDIEGMLVSGSSYAAPIFTGLLAGYYSLNPNDRMKNDRILDTSLSTDIKIGNNLKRQIRKGKYILRKQPIR